MQPSIFVCGPSLADDPYFFFLRLDINIFWLILYVIKFIKIMVLLSVLDSKGDIWDELWEFGVSKIP